MIAANRTTRVYGSSTGSRALIRTRWTVD